MNGFLFKLLALALFAGFQLHAQSTFGTILGKVKDTSGASVGTAKITVTDIDKNATRNVMSNSNGDYEASNLLPAHYRVDVTAPGFETYSATELTLVARQTLRIDAALQLGRVEETVTVNSSEEGVVATDTQAIQDTFNPQKLLNLPANIRANGNTSPYQLLQALPGVQSDNGGSFSIQGGIPSMTQYSVDGISTTDVTGNQPLTNAFPSTESISEIKVQGVGSNAEYGQVGDVTTVSKSGTNDLHGNLFWYHQNRAFDSLAFGTQEKPQKVANDFGVSGGGPVTIPHIYNGKNKTFFFGTYEGFHFANEQTQQQNVPTPAMLSGNFQTESVKPIDPITGLPFQNNQIPTSRISPIAVKFLKFFPAPNAGDLTQTHDANYIVNKSIDYQSNQYDIRVDHNLTTQQSIFARWTDKHITQLVPQNLLVPSESNPDHYQLLAAAHNFAIKPNLLNELRFGLTYNTNERTLPFNGAAFAGSLGLQGIGPFNFNGIPEIDISNLQGLNTDRGNSKSQSQTTQLTDNLTWNKGKHTFKFGVDYRHLRAVTPLGFNGADNYGTFSFDGTFSGAPFADFLLGLPIQSALDQVLQDNDGRTNHWAAYAQDSYRVSSRLTLEYGLRFELQPGYTDASGNVGNFDPSVARSGAVVYPNGKQSLLAPGYLESFNACPGSDANGAPCTPVLSAKQAGIPNTLRYAPKRFEPRLGFAWRPFNDNKTVLRGGFDMYNVTVLGSIYYALTGTLQSNTRVYNNIDANGQPLFQWPQTQTSGLGTIGSLGTAYFGTANDIHFHPPYTMQWNFSIERDLGFQTGLRVSYIGSGTRDLVWSPNLNQSYYSTTPFSAQPLSRRPFPNWGVVNTRSTGANAKYESLQMEVNHRYQSGITFTGAYTFAKNLADNQGPSPGGFAGENSGGRTMDLYNRRNEYGDVYGTRRNRFVYSAVYDIPFGKGRQFGGHMNRWVDAVAGGWQLSSIFLWQSGPYLTPYFRNGDPSGTGSGTFTGRPQMPDRVGSGHLSNQNRNDWFNLNAYVCPGSPGWTPGTPCTIGAGGPNDLAPIGRFGNSTVGTLEGPGTVNLNAGLGKYFAITEKIRLKIEGSFTNVLNHTNLNDPELRIDNSSVGQITSARGSDFGGNRTGQVGARIEF